LPAVVVALPAQTDRANPAAGVSSVAQPSRPASKRSSPTWRPPAV